MLPIDPPELLLWDDDGVFHRGQGGDMMMIMGRGDMMTKMMMDRGVMAKW